MDDGETGSFRSAGHPYLNLLLSVFAADKMMVHVVAIILLPSVAAIGE